MEVGKICSKWTDTTSNKAKQLTTTQVSSTPQGEFCFSKFVYLYVSRGGLDLRPRCLDGTINILAIKNCFSVVYLRFIRSYFARVIFCCGEQSAPVLSLRAIFRLGKLWSKFFQSSRKYPQGSLHMFGVFRKQFPEANSHFQAIQSHPIRTLFMYQARSFQYQLRS